MRLTDEIKQTGPFRSLEEEAYLNILRTADALGRALAEMLKAAGLTPTQYNVLRILRGAREDGLACGEVAERMVTRDPDVTRLLDRLESRGLIRRARETGDRRVIRTWITAEGVRILKSLDGPVATLHERQLGRLGEKRLQALVKVLEEAREEAGS
jgi:DNA-binding MarR family transcriptional regulator